MNQNVNELQARKGGSSVIIFSKSIMGIAQSIVLNLKKSRNLNRQRQNSCPTGEGEIIELNS